MKRYEFGVNAFCQNCVSFEDIGEGKSTRSKVIKFDTENALGIGPDGICRKYMHFHPVYNDDYCFQWLPGKEEQTEIQKEEMKDRLDSEPPDNLTEEEIH